MNRTLTLLAAVAWLLPAAAGADPLPAQGRLLVATDRVEGELFAKTVILLLHYDDTGAFGLVINRPTDVSPAELVDEDDVMAGYGGALYWGGPVQMDSLRVLLHAASPPGDAERIIESVYLVSYEDALAADSADPAVLRLFIGYAGWAPGQLDHELALGSWRVLPASDELVFAENPGTLWTRLSRPQEQRAAAQAPARVY